MTQSLGDFDASAVIYGKFATFRPSTGAAFTLGGTPALSVYKDNSVTQSTTGVTLTADFDSVTGLNHFAIDTSADGTFYAAGSFFDIVITTGTVDSVSVVGAVVGSFTIRKNSALKPATAGRTVVIDAAGLADANTVKVGPTGSGTAQTAADLAARMGTPAGASLAADIAEIEVETDDIAAIKTQTDKLAFTVTNQVDANVLDWKSSTAPAMTGDAFARLGAPAGASIAADLAEIEGETDALGTPAGASLAADIAAIKAAIPAALTGAGNMKVDVLALNGDTTSAANIAKTTRAIARITVGAGSTTTSIVTSACAPTGVDADQFKGRIVTFDADTTTTGLRGQATDITASSAAATPVLTVTALTQAPASGDTFSIA